MTVAHRLPVFCIVTLAMLWLTGCSTASKIDWNSRVGNFTHDQAVTEMGPPDKSASLTDGTVVSEWMTSRGFSRSTYLASPGFGVQRIEGTPSPDQYLRLTFDPSGKLKEWRYLFR